jgi:predicted  nucleic acid-binding Zn-ribbon protein
LQKYQQQMMAIKTNKEYDALVAEIDAIKQSISSDETEMLQLIEMSEGLEKEIGDLREGCDTIRDNNSKQLEILRGKIDSIGDVMSNKKSNRNEVVQSVPKQTLSIYERVRKGKGGQVVVSVKKRACGSCFKALTPKKVQEVKRSDRVYSCDHCGSIIYWDDPVSD